MLACVRLSCLRGVVAHLVRYLLLHRASQLLFEGLERFVGALAQLLVEDTTFLVDLDDGSACVVCYDSTRRIPVERALLRQGHVPWILLWQSIFVANCDMRVDQSISSRNMHQAIRVVSLADGVQLELLRLCLVIGVLNAVFDVTIEDALSPLDRIDTAGMGDAPRVGPDALQLLTLHRSDRLPVPVSLAVHVPERPRVHCRGHQRVLHDHVALRDGGGRSSLGRADIRSLLGNHIAEGL